jgi:hypothetical protein
MIRLVVMGHNQVAQTTFHCDDIIRAQGIARNIIAYPEGISHIDLFQCDDADSPSRKLIETIRPDPGIKWHNTLTEIMLDDTRYLQVPPQPKKG